MLGSPTRCQAPTQDLAGPCRGTICKPGVAGNGLQQPHTHHFYLNANILPGHIKASPVALYPNSLTFEAIPTPPGVQSKHFNWPCWLNLVVALGTQLVGPSRLLFVWVMQSHIPFATPGWISLSATWIRATEASSDGETASELPTETTELGVKTNSSQTHQFAPGGSGPCGPASGLHLPWSYARIPHYCGILHPVVLAPRTPHKVFISCTWRQHTLGNSERKEGEKDPRIPPGLFIRLLWR